MTDTQNTKPIYDKRVKEILTGLSQKITRDQLAEQFGHKNYKTLDIYMRRRNFTWDSEKITYVPKLTGNVAIVKKVMPTSKAGIVVEMMKEPNSNIEFICSKAGFEDHRQLAEYMTAKGYIWSTTDNNYKKESGLIENNKESVEKVSKEVGPIESNEINEIPMKQVNPPFSHSQDPLTIIQQYAPLLQWLESNKDKISEWIETTKSDTLPRYIIPGKANGKTIQMSDALQDMAVTFCNERNIKQRELFEVALIEFFKKYGYDYEVANLMQSY
jgi:hypothetical protein